MNFEPMMQMHREAEARGMLAAQRAKESWLIKYYCAKAIAAIRDPAQRALRLANMRRIHGNAVMDVIELSARAEYRLAQWYRSENYVTAD